MEPCHKKRLLFIALAICIVFSVFFTENLAAGEHDHDCIGEGCPVCLQIEIANNFLKTLKTAGLVMFLTVLLMSPAQTLHKLSEIAPLSYSPIMLKVRFNS